MKFNSKSTHSFPLAFFYSVMQSFDARIGQVITSLERFIAMRIELHQRFVDFDTAYQQSLKSHLTKRVHDLDNTRDDLAYVIENVSKLWATKLEDDELNIHGRRVVQVFKDYNFRASEALVAENAKVENMEQRFAETTLAADLAAMGLTELNARLISITSEIKQLIAQRNEENSSILTGEVKRTRQALETSYSNMIVYMNAIQEIMPEEGISQAAQFYNEDFRKVEMQIAQTRRKGSVSSSGTNTNPTNPTNPGDDNGGTTPENPGTSPDPSEEGENGNGGTTPDTPDNPGGGTSPDPSEGGENSDPDPNAGGGNGGSGDDEN